MKPGLNDEEQSSNEMTLATATATDTTMKPISGNIMTAGDTFSTTATTTMSNNSSDTSATSSYLTNNLKRKNIDYDDEEAVEPKNTKALAGRKLKSDPKQEPQHQSNDWSNRLKTRQSKQK